MQGREAGAQSRRGLPDLVAPASAASPDSFIGARSRYGLRGVADRIRRKAWRGALSVDELVALKPLVADGSPEAKQARERAVDVLPACMAMALKPRLVPRVDAAGLAADLARIAVALGPPAFEQPYALLEELAGRLPDVAALRDVMPALAPHLPAADAAALSRLAAVPGALEEMVSTESTSSYKVPARVVADFFTATGREPEARRVMEAVGQDGTPRAGPDYALVRLLARR